MGVNNKVSHWATPLTRVLLCCRRYATMMLSALWHGPYLGYYMTFATAALYVETCRKVRHNIRPYFVPEGSSTSNTLYYVLGWLVTCVFLNYVVGPFVMLTVEGSLKVCATASCGRLSSNLWPSLRTLVTRWGIAAADHRERLACGGVSINMSKGIRLVCDVHMPCM